MSAPDTNTRKQAKRHKPSLLGISVAVIVAGLLFFWMLSSVLVTEPDTADEAAPEQVEGTTGIPAEGSATDLGTNGAPEIRQEPQASPD